MSEWQIVGALTLGCMAVGMLCVIANCLEKIERHLRRIANRDS